MLAPLLRRPFFMMTIAIISVLSACAGLTEKENQETTFPALEKIAQASNNGDMIVSVTPIQENGVLTGYKLEFLKGAPITVLVGGNGDSEFKSVTVTDTEVTFVTTDGRTYVIKRATMLSIEFDADDLVVMSANASRDIHYTIISDFDDIAIEVTSSNDIEVKVQRSDARTGNLNVRTGPEINENSKVIIVVTNGAQTIQRTLIIEEECIRVEDDTTINVSDEGGTIDLVFFSNTACHVVIPEEAKSWISVDPETKAMTEKTIRLIIQKNTDVSREATIILKGLEDSTAITYIIRQDTSREIFLSTEREVLIAFYHVLDGDHWYNNTNWCSDKPVGDWFGVSIDEKGRITSLSMPCNNLKGQLPPELNSLGQLRQLYLESNPLLDVVLPETRPEYFQSISRFGVRYCKAITSLPSWFFELPNLSQLEISIEQIPRELSSLSQLSYLSIQTNPAPIPSELGDLTGLSYLSISGFTDDKGNPVSKDDGGVIPESIDNLRSLRSLSISCMNCIGPIPSSIVNLNNLRSLCLSNNRLSGPIPAEIGNLYLTDLDLSKNSLSGELPQSISNLNRLISFDISNNKLSGHLPAGFGNVLESIGDYSSAFFNIEGNLFTGSIPESVVKSPKWRYFWQSFINTNYFDLSDATIPAPEIKGVDLWGNAVDSESIYKANRLTILYQCNTNYSGEKWAFLFPHLNFMIELFNHYKDKNVQIISWGMEADSVADNISFCQMFGLTDWIFLNAYQRPVNQRSHYPDNWYPHLCLVDSNGNIVFDQRRDMSFYEDLTRFMSEYFGEFIMDWYESSDYSQDGTVTKLMEASKGNGVDVILMGDGFSDRQIADGTYGRAMQMVKQELFSEEPYKSMQDYFNIYSVDVVSPTEGFEHLGQSLNTYFSLGTPYYSKDVNIIRYALRAVPADRLDDALIIVVPNIDAPGGNCYTYYPDSGDYGRGLSIAYCPISSDMEIFHLLVSCEAEGFGLAKLAPETSYEEMGTVTAETLTSLMELSTYGWYKNIDFTDDPTQIKWSQFIFDKRYDADNIGCYEGGFYYWTGIWRPTENSILRLNYGEGFNAPSRFAIWYRINKLAYGENWNGTYEDFVSFDSTTRMSTPARREKRRNYVEKQLPQMVAPVVVDHSWRESLAQ